MLLVVGLGNPGAEYANNRHNVGFMAVDEIVRRHSFSAYRAKFQGDLAEGTLAGEKVLALKPMTYMNDSGRSVRAALDFYKIPPADVIVIHDEIDLAGGKVRVKRGGGHAGHNGLRSISAHIGPDYARVRLGVGHPGDKAKVAGHVLKDFAKSERDWVDRMVDGVGEPIGLLADGDDSA
ncbi:MAG: aminoacyl-tRNA hydrolase, partial [Rhodospirillaceae bacterium]